MKIKWVASNQDVSVGSYRIWIHDANKLLKSIGIDSEIISPNLTTGKIKMQIHEPESIYVLSKGDAGISRSIPRDRKCLVGAINIPVPEKNDDILPVDFVIVGSVEEKISLQEYYRNVHIVNLIEDQYSRSPLKHHLDSGSVTIGYHGWNPHLEAFKDWGLAPVVDELQKHKKIIFKCVSNDPREAADRLKGMGLNCEILCKRWKPDTVVDNIKSMDICLVPNLRDISKNQVLNTNSEIGEYYSDFLFRMKNKSNAGRSFVAYQLGIPVVADITPSNMPMLHDEKCGFIVNGPNSLYRALLFLLDHNNRTQLSKKARARFEKIYSFEEDLIQLFKRLRGK